ncbi:MAG TPA: hypothetical protein VJT31_35590, partial [Rugosimonospora sp.]|nr:hypothetical protein [Rugosimonospora sp.]
TPPAASRSGGVVTNVTRVPAAAQRRESRSHDPAWGWSTMERVRAQLKTGCVVLGLALAALVTGCGGQPPQPPDAAGSGSPVPTGPTDAWGQLAARVAAAQDKRYVAGYTLTSKGHAPRTVTVTVAQDGSWLVTVPGATAAGTDLAVGATRAGLYQCATNDASPGCVRVAGPDGRLPAQLDPRVQHLFTDWLGVLTDRQVAIAVDTTSTLPGAQGQCFSIEPSSASLAAPVDAGVYCYATDGTLTAANLGLGTLLLSGTPAPAPPTATLPAPVVAQDPVPITGGAPPAVTPSASTSPSQA